ncbi:MAG: diguanylate cyclase [Deltaproteobacteria bacterium]|nr:diguanylate cyclase [Deltaproteobacteria bacterium]
MIAPANGKGKKKPAGSLKEPCVSPQEFSRGVEFVRSLDPKAGLEPTLRNIARLASRLAGGDGCLIHLLHRERNLLEAACRQGAGREFAAPLKPGRGVSGSAFRQKKPVSASNLMKEPAEPWARAAQKEGFTSALSLPLRGRQSTLGTITLLRREARPHGAVELALLRALADQAAVAIEDARSYEKLQERLKTLSREKKREGQIKTFLENIVDRSADPIMATDLHGKFTFASRGAEEMFGLPKEELLGKKISQFYTGGEREARKIMKVLAKKEKLRNYETEFVGPGDKTISVILSASLLKDGQGNPVGTLGVTREITEYKNLLNHITRTEQSYQKLFEAVNDAIFYLNREGYFSTFNRMFLRMTGYTEKEIRSFHFSKILHPDDIPMMVNDHQKVIRGDYAPERYTFRLVNKEEKVIYVEGNFRRLKEKNVVVGILAVLRDVTEKIRLEKELLELSITDGLTGLHNQRHFYTELDKEMERVKRQHTPLSLLLFDLDDFKVFNDIHGHLEGDKVLRSVAQVVLKSIRRMDSAYRYGGDEFTVILPGASQVEASQVAERIRKTFETTPYLQQIKLSIGLVEFDPQYDLTNFVKHADEAMYTAKKRGGNQIFIEN